MRSRVYRFNRLNIVALNVDLWTIETCLRFDTPQSRPVERDKESAYKNEP